MVKKKEERWQKWRRLNKKKYEYQNLKAHAKARKVPFTLTYEHFLSIYCIYCPVLGVKMAANKKKVAFNSRTFDRVDSDKGYEDGNMQCISHLANTRKGDMTVEQQNMLAMFFLKMNIGFPLELLKPYLDQPEKYSHLLQKNGGVTTMEQALQVGVVPKPYRKRPLKSRHCLKSDVE